MNDKKKINLIQNHLINWGLYSTTNIKDYLNWVKFQFNKLNIPNNKIKKLCNLEEKMHNPKYSDTILFYDFIAHDESILKIIHSERFNEIVINGFNILKDVNKNGCYLDLGCNAGYLTSFYADYFKKSTIVGFDRCKKSIKYAKKNVNKNNNLYYFSQIEKLKKYKFDYIFDTQCLSSITKPQVLYKILHSLHYSLSNKTKMISIANLNDEVEALTFFNDIGKFGFHIINISPLFFSSILGKQAFTKIIFIREKQKYNYDIEKYFYVVRKKIGS